MTIGWISHNKLNKNLKNPYFWKHQQQQKRIKKEYKKSLSLLFLNGHPVNLILSVSQLAAWLEVSLSFLPFWFLCHDKYLFLILLRSLE